MSDGESLRIQDELRRLRGYHLEGKLAHAEQQATHDCSIEGCSQPANDTLWLEDSNEDNWYLCERHYAIVTEGA